MEARVAGRRANATAVVQRLTLVLRGGEESPPAASARGFAPEKARVGRARVGCLSDDDLTALVAEGSEQTLAELDDRYGRMAYGLALGIVGEPAIAERVVETTIHAAWRESRATATPLHAAAAMLARVHSKSVESSLAPAEPEHGPLPLETFRPPPSGGAWELEREPVHQALLQLPDEERELLVLAYYAGLSAAELTGGVATSAGTATTRMEVGLSRLAAALASTCEEDAEGGFLPHFTSTRIVLT
jgi:RNA polymerase sigma-70 factor (ECF subfamily)